MNAPMKLIAIINVCNINEGIAFSLSVDCGITAFKVMTIITNAQEASNAPM
jgi:hypothetical protein